MSRTIRLTLYRPHDYDLYCLYFDTRFRFNEAVRAVLTAYVYGLDPPRIDVTHIAPLRKGHEKTVSVGVLLKDPKILEMWDYMFTHGRTGNNFVKTLLRRSLVGVEGLYFQNAEGEYQDPRLNEDYNDIFRTKIYPAKWLESKAAKKAREYEAREMKREAEERLAEARQAKEEAEAAVSAELESANREIASLHGEIQRLTRENKKGSQRETRAKATLKTKNAELRKIRKELDLANRKVEDAEAKAADVEEQIRKQADELAARSRFELDAVYEKASAIEEENRRLKEKIRSLEEAAEKNGLNQAEQDTPDADQPEAAAKAEAAPEMPANTAPVPENKPVPNTVIEAEPEQTPQAEEKKLESENTDTAPKSIFDIADSIISQFL